MGFEAQAWMTDKPAKSLHRMLSRVGNPSMDNPAAILDAPMPAARTRMSGRKKSADHSRAGAADRTVVRCDVSSTLYVL